MRLGPRVRTLERRARRRPVRPCPECSAKGGEPEFRVVLSGGDPGPERCPRCGRQLVFRVQFDRMG